MSRFLWNIFRKPQNATKFAEYNIESFSHGENLRHSFIFLTQLFNNLQLNDIAEAISICDRVLVLSARPAVILDDVDLDDMKDLSALERREHARFSALFERIWRELQ